MPLAVRRRLPKPTRRRALELLAAEPDGMIDGLLLAHGFTVPLLVDLVRAGLATVGPRTIKVARVRITAEGRQAARKN